MSPVCWQIISLELTADKHGHISSGLELVQPILHIYCNTVLTCNPVSWLAWNSRAGASLYLTQKSRPFTMWIRCAAHRLVKNKSSMKLQNLIYYLTRIYCWTEVNISLCSLSYVLMLMRAKEKLRRTILSKQCILLYYQRTLTPETR